MFDDTVQEDGMDKFSTCDYEQYFLHSFENIPIKISNSKNQVMQISNENTYAYRHQLPPSHHNDDNNFWNLQTLGQYSHKHRFNSTFIKDPDEFSTEL